MCAFGNMLRSFCSIQLHGMTAGASAQRMGRCRDCSSPGKASTRRTQPSAQPACRGVHRSLSCSVDGQQACDGSAKREAVCFVGTTLAELHLHGINQTHVLDHSTLFLHCTGAMGQWQFFAVSCVARHFTCIQWQLGTCTIGCLVASSTGIGIQGCAGRGDSQPRGPEAQQGAAQEHAVSRVMSGPALPDTTRPGTLAGLVLLR